MNWQRFRGFLARRLSREQYLGLHLTVGLLLSLLLLGLFAIVARQVTGGRGLTEFDEWLELRLYEHREASLGLRDFFRIVTWLGSFRVIAALTLAVSLLLALRGRRRLALVWLVALCGAGVLNSGLKEIFERPRPELRDPAVFEDTYSFPSGHAMGSLICYGLLAYLLLVSGRPLWLRVTSAVVLSVLVLLIGFSRLYLAAHYLTDVLGGYAVGGCWLAAIISGLEVVRRRRGHRHRAGSDAEPPPAEPG